MIYICLRLRFLICMTQLLTIYLQGAVSDQKVSGPGASSCILGMIASTCIVDAPLDDFPDSCTSFFFEALSINEKHEVSQAFDEENNVYLDLLGKTGKRIYVVISRGNYTQWTKFLDCDGQTAVKDANGINAYNSHHSGIKGLLLRDLQPYSDSEEIVGYTQKVLKYIDTVKINTGLEIALEIRAFDFLEYHNNPQGPCLNYTELNASVDFYSFRLYYTDKECTATLKTFGRKTKPFIDGDGKYTLEKLEAAIRALLIPKNKVLFHEHLAPRSVEQTDYICEVNYQSMCTNPENAKYWCADTQETQFQKGQWFHQNGAGFIGNFIDFDDPRGCCKCGPFPSFNAILAGFNGTASVPKCPLYDRLC